MKVVFNHLIFCDQEFGGISRYFFELAKGLSWRNDFEVSVVAPFHANEYLCHGERSLVKGPYFNRSFRGSCRIRHFGQKLLQPIQYWQNRNADILHETYYSTAPAGSGRFRILTVYDMIHELFEEQFSGDLVTSKAKIAAVGRADHVVCISESTRRDLIRLLNVPPHKTSVVYLGHSLTGGEEDALPARSPGGKPYLLYVGNRWGYKNFSAFCRAFAGSDVLKKNFDVVAFGGPGFDGDEQKLLQGLDLCGRVHHVVGGDSLLKDYYLGATLFVYPSLYEGFGIPPLEAMSFDCPVVCSDSSSIPEVVGDAGIYFDPHSIDSMRDAMERVLGSEALASQLVVKGRERIKLFSWRRCVTETAAVYKAVACGGL